MKDIELEFLMNDEDELLEKNPDIQLLKINNVCIRVGLSESVVYDRMKKGQFPKTLKFGKYGKCWLKSNIDNWINERIEERDNACVELSEIEVLKNHVTELQRERDELKALAEDRLQFIVNSVDLGYCSLPDESINDPANDTYKRCNLDDAYAIAELQAKAVEDFVLVIGSHYWFKNQQKGIDAAVSAGKRYAATLRNGESNNG